MSDVAVDQSRPTSPTATRRLRRRWPWLILVGVAVLAAVAATIAFVWFPRYRPSLHQGERYGIDVSNHQGVIDWSQVAADEISFAYIKATEGGDNVDRRFVENWEGAAVAGVERGAYHFFTLCTPGRTQVEHFLEVVPRDERALPPAVDLELAGNCAARPPSTMVRRQLDEFLAAVESTTGQRVVLYVGDDFEDAYPVRKELDRPLWHRRIFWRADVKGWWIWQFTGWGRVDGIRGRVDVNVMREGP